MTPVFLFTFPNKQELEEIGLGEGTLMITEPGSYILTGKMPGNQPFGR